jgi:hypothetical protein
METRSNRIASISATLVLTGIVLGGCTQSPKEDIDQVKAALDEIKAAKAAVYAPEDLKAAEDAYNFAMATVQEQKKKFAFFRSYSHAEVLLAEAKKIIEDAKEAAEVKREEARRDAEALIEEAKESFASAEVTMGRAPSRRRLTAKPALEDAKAMLYEAEKDYKDESFLEARIKAEDAKARVEKVVTNLGSVQN